MLPTISKSAITLSVLALPRACAGSLKITRSAHLHRTVLLSLIPKELLYESHTRLHRRGHPGGFLCWSHRADCVGSYCAVPFTGHCSDSRKTEIHDADSSTADREDHGGCHRRQRFLER